MSIKKIKFSIILPYYNGKDFIDDCLKSIVNQTYSNFELLIVDDGSPNSLHSDYVKELISSYNDTRIFYHLKANGGLSDARNFGTHHSNGEYIAFIDQDDMWKPEKLEKQAKVISETGAKVVISNYEAFGSNSFTVDFSYLTGGKSDFIKNTYCHMLRNNIVDSISIVFSRELLPEIGLSNRRFFVAPDYEYFLRMARKVDFYLINQALTLYRLHENNTINQLARLYSEIITILFESKPNSTKEKWNASIQLIKMLLLIVINWVKILKRK